MGRCYMLKSTGLIYVPNKIEQLTHTFYTEAREETPYLNPIF